jgi:VanZ family protein
MRLSGHQKITAGLLILYWLALFTSTHIPIPQVVQEADVSDKGLHLLANLILIFLFWFTISDGRKVQWRKIGPWCALAVMIVYAIFDELTQSFVPGRSCDPRDLVADLSGTCTGLIAFSFLSFWPAGLLVSTAIILIGANIAEANLSDVMPSVNAAFHLISYVLLTSVWIQCIRLFIPAINPRSTGAKWLVTALAVPAGMLITAKLLSLVSGRELVLMNMCISAVASVVVVTTFYFKARYSRDNQKEDKKELVT